MMRTLLLLVSCAVSACAVRPMPETVRAGETITTDLIQFKVPGSGAWNVQKRHVDSVAIASSGPSVNSTIIAMAYLFKTPTPSSKEHFLELVRAGVREDLPADGRFRQIEAKVEYEGQRGYHCARRTVVHEDRQAPVGGGGTKSLRMESHSLYCTYPFAQGMTTMRGFSHRGEGAMEGFDQQARRFIEGVSFREQNAK
jgi:hypothetical protein